MAYDKKYIEEGNDVGDYLNDREDNIEGAFESLIESGSNANGRWIKFPDGTMICTLKSLTLSNKVPGFISGDWVFPHPFSGQPDYVDFNLGSDTIYWAVANDRKLVSYTGIQYGGLTNETAPLRIVAGEQDFAGGSIIVIGLFAIGRWK